MSGMNIYAICVEGREFRQQLVYLIMLISPSTVILLLKWDTYLKLGLRPTWRV